MQVAKGQGLTLYFRDYIYGHTDSLQYTDCRESQRQCVQQTQIRASLQCNLLDVAEDPVEFIERIIANIDGALIVAAMFNANTGTELFRQIVFEGSDMATL